MTKDYDAYRLVRAILAEEEREMVYPDKLDLDECRSRLQLVECLLSVVDKQIVTYRQRYEQLYERVVAHSRMEQVTRAQELLDLPHFALLDPYCDPDDSDGGRYQDVGIDCPEELLFKATSTSFGVMSALTDEIPPLE